MVARSGSPLPLPDAERVLLVEGQDDKHVVEHLYWKRFGSPPPFSVVDKGGFTILRDEIGPELKVPGRRVLGIVVDANDDFQSRWAAMTDRLRRALPDIEIGDPGPRGTILPTKPRVGIWLWPDNESGGEIEDFVSKMIPGDDPVWPLSKRYIEGIPAEHRRFSEGKTARAKLHAWLAATAEPKFMGTAIRAGHLGVHGKLATRFANWLEMLFGEQG